MPGTNLAGLTEHQRSYTSSSSTTDGQTSTIQALSRAEAPRDGDMVRHEMS